MKNLFVFVIIVYILVVAIACSSGSRMNASSVGSTSDPNLESTLQTKLLELLVASGKIDAETGKPRVTSTPPSGEINKPQMILSETKTDGTLLLRFTERLTGDYDLSGDIGIPDITPIAQNYLAPVEWYGDGTPVPGVDNETLAVIDGDKSGEIGIADITPIANYYLNTLSGYSLYRDGTLIPGAGDEPTLPRPQSGEYGWRDGRWPVYEYSDSPGGIDRYIVYTLKPVDSDGSEGESYEFTVHYTPSTPINDPPAKPTGLVATPGDTIVSLDWDDNTETDLAGYNVYLSLTSGTPPVSPVNTTLLTDSEYIATDLINGTPYYFWIKAVDDGVPAKLSVFSDEASATPEAVIVLTPPTGLTATPGDTTVQLDWDDSTDPNVTGYNVYQSNDELDTNPALITPTPIAQSELLVEGLTNDMTYYFWVTTTDSETPPNESKKTGPENATPSATANETPIASADANPKSGIPALAVDFYSTGSFDPDGTIVMYRWDFTDDATWDYENATTGDTQFTYDTPGYYTARLQVEDDAGATGEDTVNISVIEPGGWTIEEVPYKVTLQNLALDHFPTGEPAIACKIAGDESKYEVDFFTKKGETFTKETVSSSGGDGLQLAIGGDSTVYIGHAQWNEWFEDSAYVHYKTDSSLVWTQYGLENVQDYKTVALGASPEKFGCVGLQTLGHDFVIHTDITGSPDKYLTEVRAENYANIAMKSDTEAALWMLEGTAEPQNWYLAMLKGNTWNVSKENNFDSMEFTALFQAQFAVDLNCYVLLGCETMTDSELLRRVIWDGSEYAIDKIEMQRWRGITRFGAIGPRGEVFYIYTYNDGPIDRTAIYCYLDSENIVEDVPLEGRLADEPAQFAEIDVRPDGMVGVAYQMGDEATDASVLYYATFPHPIPES